MHSFNPPHVQRLQAFLGLLVNQPKTDCLASSFERCAAQGNHQWRKSGGRPLRVPERAHRLAGAMFALANSGSSAGVSKCQPLIDCVEEVGEVTVCGDAVNRARLVKSRKPRAQDAECRPVETCLTSCGQWE
jgi:hypothetical protein